MIYVIENINQISEDFISAFLPKMPVDRQEKALRYRRQIDRNLCVMGYWLLCYGLQTEHGIWEHPRFSYGKYGKPYLSDYAHIHFNISHCNIGVACVVSQHETGIDMQHIRPYNFEVAKHVCTDDEMTDLAACQTPQRLFCKLWSVKESYAKLLGTGLGHGKSTKAADWIITQLHGDVVMRWGNGYHLCCLGKERDLVVV